MKRFIAAISAAAALAVPSQAAAVAHDTYVDQGTGTDGTNTCATATNPCKTVVRGLAVAGNGKTVFVAGGHTYTANITLEDGKSLVHKNFGGATGPAILDNGSGSQPAVFVPAVVQAGHTAGAGKVKGFTIRSEMLPLDAGADVRVIDDVFDEDAAIDEDVAISAADGNIEVKGSTFTDPTPLTSAGNIEKGVATTSEFAGTLKLSHNEVSDFQVGISAAGFGDATVTIKRNNISGVHNAGSATGAAINAFGPNLTVDDNRLAAAATAGFPPNGLAISGPGSADGNVAVGFSAGVFILDDVPGTTKLSNDVIVVPAGYQGIFAEDLGADEPNVGKVKGTNLTIVGPPSIEWVGLTQASLRLDSSLVSNGTAAISLSGTCDISYSRGPVKHKGGDGCKDFKTTAKPKLKADGIHLKGSSPLVDKGNPKKPEHGERDIDGDKRALVGRCGKKHRHDKPRRDIGADEIKCPPHHG